ncbi:MAG: LEA type 2 family protein [Flavobacteriales bacterium]|nr:LEA type 2 family protein [Flavobacteriales bacterium]
MRISVFLFVLTICLSSCISYKPVEFKGLNNVAFSEDKSCSPMCVSVSVYNPNKFKISIKKANILAFVNSNELGDISVREKSVLPALETSELRFAINTTKSNLAKSLFKSLDVLLGKKMHLKLDGKLKVKAFGIGVKIPVEESYELDYKSFIR